MLPSSGRRNGQYEVLGPLSVFPLSFLSVFAVSFIHGLLSSHGKQTSSCDRAINGGSSLLEPTNIIDRQILRSSSMSPKQPYIESATRWDVEDQTSPRPEPWVPIPPANSPAATKDAATTWESNIETDPAHLAETKLDLKSSFETFMKEAFDHAMENLTTKMNTDCTTKLQDGIASHSADVVTTVSYKYQPRWPDKIDVSEKAAPFFPEVLTPSVASECCNWAFSPIPMSARGLKDGRETVPNTVSSTPSLRWRSTH